MVILPHNIYNEIMYFVQKCETEVSGMGRVTILENGDMLVNKVYLLEQEVGAAHTDIDAEAIARLLFETREDEGDLLYWWHSHVNMAAFWSGQDTSTIRAMGANGLCVASVFNKKGESRHAICYKTTIDYTGRNSLQLDDNVHCTIGVPPTKEETEAWDKLLAEKVRRKPVVNPAPYSHHSLYYDAHRSYQDESVIGIMGYGLENEARALGMTKEAYLGVIEGSDARAYRKVEDKLYRMWKEGSMEKWEGYTNE